ncbi:MAG: alpha/beta hydrolase [Bdellovibrionota bacterium]
MIVRSNDGTLLFGQSFRCAQRARGALLVVHGLGEHGGRYEDLVEQALQLRFDVHVMDLRGHGRSKGTRGHFTDLGEHHADLDAWIAHLVSSGELSDKIPCVLLGHSLGGLIALTYAARYVAQPPAPLLSGLILSNPCLGLRWNPMLMVEAQLARKVPGFLNSLQVPNGIDPQSLSHDASEIERYLDDPLVHKWITPAAFNAIERGIASLPKLYPQLGMPTLFMLSGKDKVVDTSAAQHFAEKLGVAHPGKVEVKLFHSFFHEPFHELKKERAFLELKKWILQCVIPPSPAKAASSKYSGKGATAKGTSP